MTSKSLYENDYEIIEKEFINANFEFICNINKKHIIGFICKFYDENGNIIKTLDDSTLNIYNIFSENNEIQRFIQPKFKNYFTVYSSDIDQIKYDEDQWSYFMNVNNNNCQFKFVFNLIIDSANKYNRINIKLILIYDRIFTKKDSLNGKEYNHLGMPFLGYYLDHIPDLKYLSCD
jgi:hypothetical protein